MESLARHLARVVVPAGTLVIREGEVGDRWYLIADGRFAVSQAGRHLRTMDAGERSERSPCCGTSANGHGRGGD